MKKIFFILILYAITHHSSTAQWIQQNSGTNVNLYDIEFLNENTGWAVGDGGVVLKTINGGKNWVNIPNPAEGKLLKSIHIIDSNYIYFAGWFETIIKSTDGGSSWIVIRNGTAGQGSSYDGLYFINKETGWICGTGLKVLRTTNGGINLDSSYLLLGSMSDMYFKDFNNGLICADGAVFKTTNSGISWFDTNVPINGVFYRFRKLAVVNNNIWAIGGSYSPVYYSSDFGESWKIRDTLSEIGIVGNNFADSLTGYAGGGLHRLYKTTNGGYNWRQEDNGHIDNSPILSIKFINKLTGWYVSGIGHIFKTTTGGQTLVSISNQNNSISKDFKLYQNYPNPFNPLTTIDFTIPESNSISLNIFNLNGKFIKSIFKNEYYKKGKYSINFNADALPSGVYIYSIKYKKYTYSKRMILIK
ncbi:MAG TPA: YCF48-related protein [Ignavibacteria bacterium]|nr:YCF48-related protein [Ignavibacteria bacterium]